MRLIYQSYYKMVGTEYFDLIDWPQGRAIKNGCSHGDGECLDHTFMIHYDKLCRVLWQMWKQKP